MRALADDPDRSELYATVVRWSTEAREVGARIETLRERIASLMGPWQPMMEHYMHPSPEDIAFRLLAGQVPDVGRHVTEVLDHADESYGPIPTPLAYVHRLVGDLDDARLLREDLRVDDVGCGTGLAAEAMAIFSKVRLRIRGIDWNPAALQIARRSAESLRIPGVSFDHDRAQHMDVSQADLFYLHTPFVGHAAVRFWGRLRREAERRRFAVATLFHISDHFHLAGPFENVNGRDGYNDGAALFLSKP